MTIHSFDPLHDSRWPEFVQQHPRASIFHTRGWLEALQKTYGYEPVVFTTSAPNEELNNGVVFCRVRSWLTGNRLVSVPFSDHCEPLVDDARSLQEILDPLVTEFNGNGWKFIEVRLRTEALAAQSALAPNEGFAFHTLDLRPTLDQIHRSFDKDSVQRRIRRAERESLEFEEGSSEDLLQKFYRLQMVTRRRHQIPPQPIQWFRNLIESMQDQLKIRVAFKDGHAVASILTLRFRDSLVYKYGCSDARFNNLGATVILLWKAIQEGKAYGLTEFDWGKSDWDNPGLVNFKDNWGTERSQLSYVRYPARPRHAPQSSSRSHLAKAIFSCIPDGFLTAAGRMLYRHIG